MASQMRTGASLAVLLVILIFITIYISTADLSSRRFSLPFLPLHSPARCAPSPSASTSAAGALTGYERQMPPLCVYMYDLPRRFNFAMMDHRHEPDTESASGTGKDFPPWPPSWGIKKQHSVEYWMTVSLLSGDKESAMEFREAVRVHDGEEADVFFVPFFSSLSFNSHGRYMTDPDTEIDRNLQSTSGMRSSKFCLHPAGDTPSSCRLFDAIVSHCVPVIVSDHIELPFETELDYTDFSIFFSVDEALEPGYMVAQLRTVSKDRWLELWKKLKAVSHHYEFQYPPKRGDAVNMLWRQVRQKLPAARLEEHRSRRLKVPDWW